MKNFVDAFGSLLTREQIKSLICRLEKDKCSYSGTLCDLSVKKNNYKNTLCEIFVNFVPLWLEKYHEDTKNTRFSQGEFLLLL